MLQSTGHASYSSTSMTAYPTPVTSSPTSLGSLTSSWGLQTSTSESATDPHIWFYILGGIAGSLFLALLVAIAIILLLAIRKKQNSGKLVFRHDSQTVSPSTGAVANVGVGITKNSDKFFVLALRNDADRSTDTAYRSKSESMESLGCISDQDEVSTIHDLVVPTQGQRKNIAENIMKGSSRHLYVILQKQQKSLLNVMKTNKNECCGYWKPSFVRDDLYQQLFENKYVEIPRNKIKVLSYLRSEMLGIVHKGLWDSSEGTKEVAVRMLHENATAEEEVVFLHEAAIHGQFSNHPNVVHLHGLATLKNPILIIMEYLENDIKSYLTLQRTIPEASVLLSFCQQVASGMKFLSDQNFIHRYLMAQNVFLTESGVCKIGGFGTSFLLENEELRVSHGISIPIRWASPEVLHSKRYSVSSDVWAYGVLMYEIWSTGHTPYEQLTDQEVIKAVNNGTRLAQPTGCPQAIYQVMSECWHSNPDSRPTFHVICTKLDDISLHESSKMTK